jgi:hypothetical protein
MKKSCLAALIIFLTGSAFSQKALYLAAIKDAAEQGWRESPQILEQWKKNTKPNILWGYDSPAHPVYLASTLAFLYEETKNKEYARKAAHLLATYGDLRENYPPEHVKARIEYEDGLPALGNFFFMPPYVRAYLKIRNAGVLDDATRKKIETDVAGSADFVFRFPEWGAHNRAMLRAEALQYAALAMPNHPHASSWKKLADAIAGDNLTQWEVEDASIYHPVWLASLYSYAEAAGKTELFDSPLTKYYQQYFLKLIGPHGTIPEFGDARWSAGWDGLRFVPYFEKGAAVFKDPQLKWAAKSIFDTYRSLPRKIGVGEAYHLCDAYRWSDESVKPQRPTSLSQEVLEDLAGKKVVFRDGWEPASTYMLLNYRDEGDGGWLHREYLRQSISVEEEKMHHGHADENSIPLLMSRGSVLLHDADYRSALPSGPFGAWRQDYFHNRLVARSEKKDPQQSLLEFVRNSGAYRAVRTQKIDFLNLKEVDMSRTRLIDQQMGYESDRIIAYLKQEGWFVVIDAVKILRTGYFTFATLWHAQTILEKGSDFYDVRTDSIQGFKFPSERSLLIFFPETYAKKLGDEPISRSYQQEHMISQTISSQYKAGDVELFVTVLIPHGSDQKTQDLRSRVKLLDVSTPFKAAGLGIDRVQRSSILGVKVDLEMEVARENIRPRYLYSLGKVAYGDFETDAHFFFATTDEKKISYSASNVLKVLFKGKPLMQALPNTHGLQLDGAPDRVGYTKWRYWEDTVEKK